MENLMAIYEKRANYTEAAALMAKMVAQFPQHPSTVRLLVKRADDLFQADRFAEAAAAYAAIKGTFSPATAEKMKIAQIAAKAGGNPEPLLESADLSLKNKDLHVAATLYTLYMKKAPKSPRFSEAKTKLGWCIYQNNDADSLKKAEQLWREVVAGGPSSGEFVGESQWHLVQLLAGPKNNQKEAIALCDTIARTFPKGSERHEQALFAKAWMYWAREQWSEAKRAFDDLTSAYPEKLAHPPIIKYMADCRAHIK